MLLTKKTVHPQGFTLIEMIMAVTVLGVLTAVTISSLNAQRQRQRAADAVTQTQIEQVAQALEAYQADVGRYPPASDGVPTAAELDDYLSSWPTGFTYVTDANGTQFAAYALISNNTYFKYSTSWSDIETCSATNIDQISVCEQTSPGVILASIAATPTNASLPKGTTLQYQASAVYSDGSTAYITNLVAWDVQGSATQVVSITAGGLVSALNEGSANVTISYQNKSASTPVTVTPAVTQVAVNPSSITMIRNNYRDVTATATMHDGKTVDVTKTATWTSSNTAVVMVLEQGNGIRLRAVGTGTATVRALYDGVSGTATVTVTNPITLIAVSPASATLNVGSTTNLTATATYQDGSTANVTNSAAWTSSNTAVATVAINQFASTALVTGRGGGTATITASLEGISGTSSITVNSSLPYVTGVEVAPVTVRRGQTGSAVCYARYSDGSRIDVSRNSGAAWATGAVTQPAGSTIARYLLIANTNCITGQCLRGSTAGSQYIRCTYSGQYIEAVVTVIP